MRKIEALIELEKLGTLRESLREMGVKTLRVAEIEESGPLGFASGQRRPTAAGQAPHSLVRVGVVVPDDLADTTILLLLGTIRDRLSHECREVTPLIEKVVRLDPGHLIEGLN